MDNFLNVFRRELRRMTSRRIYFASCIVLPLFSLVFMATIFGHGQMENLPVGVVDADRTSLSRSIVRMVDATPELQVTKHYANETEARKAMQKKEIYGYLLIPSGIKSLCYYYHTEHCIVIIITEGLDARRDEQVSINLFSLYSLSSLRFIGILLRNLKFGSSINHSDDTSGKGSLVNIHHSYRQILHLSMAKDCCHEDKREQRKHDA